jgi:DNA-binding response OmpR family regulator
MTSKQFSQSIESVSASPKPQPNPRQRILVVEDDKFIRRLNSEVLTYSGYQVDTAEDGAVAWDVLQLNNYDLMVTDNDMPKVTGVQLIQKLQNSRMNLPVVMATGSVPYTELTRHPMLQPAVVLLKPYTFDELLETVKAVLYASWEGRAGFAPPPNWQIQPLQPLANRFQL